MCRVLIIDDDPDFVAAFSSELRAAGHDVTAAAGSAEGVSTAVQSKFDAVLVDIYMPETDGLETIRELRRAGVGVPIIAISSGGSMKVDFALRWATGLGADASLPKALAGKRLIELLDGGGAAAQGAPS
jgi:CheY-like chemotaxis protein